MNFSISKQSFSQLLYLASTIVERRNTMPILANVKLSVDKGKLTVSATDLEISLIGETEADVTSPGSITVGAKMLFEIVRELPSDTVTLNLVKGGRLELESGTASYKINGTSAEEFPTLVGCELKDPVSVEAKKLFDMLDKTSYAVSTDETRYNINGVYIETLDSKSSEIKGGIRFVATDGHRLALVDRPAEGMKLKKSVIVPRKGITELKKVLENNEGAAKVSLNDGFFTVKSGGVTMGVRLVDGQFPDYRQVIPKETKTVVSTSKNDLLATIKRVALVTTDRSKTVKIEVSGDTMTLSSSSPEYGEAVETVGIEKDGEDISIGFSARYLIDLLGSMGSEEKVNIKFNGDLGPGIFTGANDDNYRSVVMPMRFE